MLYLIVFVGILIWLSQKTFTESRHRRRATIEDSLPSSQSTKYETKEVVPGALLPRSFVAFDIETTGLDPIEHEIVEIAGVRFSEGKEVGTFHSFVNPGRSIPRAASLYTWNHYF